MSDIHFDVPFTRYKHVEFEFTKDNPKDFSVRLNLTTKGDHTGLRFYVELGRLFFGATFYDDRHWDWNNDTYENYEKKGEDQ